MPQYIHQHKNWPNFTWNESSLNALFGEVRYLQGRLYGLMQTLGFSAIEEATLRSLSLEVVKSSEIEGEFLNYEKVRSSIAHRLGIETVELLPSDHRIEGVVDIVLDATHNYQKPLTEERLFGWHAALFPTGFSGRYPIEVGRYRSGEMQIVSGAMGKEKVHFEAIAPKFVPSEMDQFLTWFNNENKLDLVLKSAIAHLWFIIIHPFDDGNGRIARTISDLLLTRAEKSTDRFYSMSSQILLERKQYYTVLEKVQHSTGDITEWMEWFLNCLKGALLQTESSVQNILNKALFWKIHEHTPLNERQRLMLNKLLDGIDGKLNTSKWAKMAKCSSDTAIRDIQDLIEKNILRKAASGGRSTHYELIREES